VGLALSAEKRLDRLLDLIVRKAMDFSGADGGTLYLCDEEGTALRFAIVQNDSLGLRMGGAGDPIDWPPVPLTNEDGRPNRQNVSAWAANTRELIRIPDVYDAPGFDFEGTRRFDRRTGYRSRSMLVVPLTDHEDEVVGVLQLLNARDAASGRVTDFDDTVIETIRALASQAAVAVNNVRLIEGLRRLLDSFIEAIATAIDEKSPYTGGHIRRVAELALELADAVSEAREGVFADRRFSAEEREELRYAAWMHDVGKISTPQHVVDKATRLEALCDRIEIIRLRMELYKREAEAAALSEALRAAGEDPARLREAAGLPDLEARLEADLAFLREVNRGGEFLSDGKVARIRGIAEAAVRVGDRSEALIDRRELENLCLRRGTLNEEERRTVNQHVVVTRDLLGRLPFPRKFRNVPAIAAAHHEKLNGSGYPAGLAAADLPLQARILAVADVFEALTAADRPYKRGNRLSEAVRILWRMVQAGELDGDLCGLLVNGGVAERYARRNMKAEQRDAFRWPPADEGGV